MLPGVTLPASLAALLGALRPCFTAPSFRTFCGLAAGLAGQVRRRTVCGMLLGADLARAWPHDRAHYFFARARWQVDELGLARPQPGPHHRPPPRPALVPSQDRTRLRRHAHPAPPRPDHRPHFQGFRRKPHTRANQSRPGSMARSSRITAKDEHADTPE